MPLVTATILVHDSLAVPMDGVTVRVFQADGTTFVSEGVTGSPTPSSGEVEFTLSGDGPGVTYVIRLSRAGYFFPAGATQSIVVTDPPVPDNDFGPYEAVAGPTDELVTLVVQDDAVPTPGAIEDVRIRVYDAGDVFVTEGTTDIDGELELFLPGSVSPGTTYIIRLWKADVIFPNPTQSIVVLHPVTPPSTNVFDFTGTVVGVPTSTDPHLCMVYGRFSDVSLGPAKRLRLEFKPIPVFPTVGQDHVVHRSSKLIGTFNSCPAVVGGKILTRSVKVDTDDAGFFQVELPREGFFEVHIHGFEDPIEITERIYVPDAANAKFEDLFFPVMLTVTYGTDPLNLLVDESVEVDFVATLSNTYILTDIGMLSELLTFSVGDDTIATVTLSSASTITVKGIATGSTTVEVARTEELVVPSRPAVPALGVTPPVVNVT